MTLRRKLAITTIATSVAMSAFAGIPLSNKGLAEKLGFDGVAYAAAASFPSSTVTTKVTALRAALIETGGLGAVQALRAAINGIPNSTKGAIAQPIVEKFMKDIEVGEQPAKSAVLKNLFVDALSLTYDPNLTDLEALRLAYNQELSEYAAAAGVSDLTVEDIVSYFMLAQEEAMDILESKTLTQLAALLTDPEGFNELFEQALANMPAGTNPVKTVFLYYGITTEDVQSTISALKAAVNNNETFLNAALALFAAYEEMTDIDTPPVTGPSTPPVVELPASVTELNKKLDELKDKLATASDEEKAALVAAAVQEAQAVVDKLSNLASTVTVENGKATLKLDENKALSAIAGIAAAAAALQAATGESLPALNVTIDFGDVAEDNAEIGLSEAVMQQAASAGLTGISLKVGGLTVGLPVGGTFSKAVDFSINKSDASEEVTGGQQAVSQVYDFNLTVGGVATTSFSQPITISIPLGNTEGVDTELLSVAKIVDGKLQIQGGKVEGNSIVESRDQFSSYVVVENKVSFGDTADVEAWAGRAIEVIAAKGAINGKAEGVFDPSANVTRAEFAKMLVHALDLDNINAKESFTDVKAGDWFAPYVAAASQAGIINGRSAKTFDPYASITRAEMATMVARALKAVHGTADVANVNAALEGFSDAGAISESLKQGVAFAANHEIVVGNNGQFAPNASATRAQAAVIIYRAFNFEA
ncbi:S-layer homology domain-containing protein [Paenibacillus sp. LHD-117]|uniref:S-layer homology domain-containing protein n=1 Tax=Paenibacillus sp. LHD-117 TaxID=3071412 RepID=UPI0027DFA8C6|nr:S-layer homology domain-containing protein [Paenibacillus sp. LHD-117]MDQ6420689.1 S-layer homology domain-containing protein [Paenibacillus sp. LHD-117]